MSVLEIPLSKLNGQRAFLSVGQITCPLPHAAKVKLGKHHSVCLIKDVLMLTHEDSQIKTLVLAPCELL